MAMPAKKIDLGQFFFRTMLAVGIGFCVAWSQWAGWSVTGILLADGSVKRGVQATEGNLAETGLRNLRAERDGLKLPDKPRKALEAKLDLELRKTSRQYPNGDGPAALDIKAQIATLDRAAELDVEIEKAMKKLKAAPTVSGGDVDVAIPVGIVQRLGWVDPEAKSEAIAADVRFWSVVSMVGMMGFFATFGFRLVGITHADLHRNIVREKPIIVVPLIFLAVEAGMNMTYGWRRADGSLLNLPAYFQAAMYAGVAVLGAFLPTQWDALRKSAPTSPEQEFLDRMDWGAPRLAAGGERQLYDELVRLYGPEAAEHLTVDPQVSALKAKLAEAMKDPVAPVRGRGEWRTPPAPGEMPAEPRPPLNGAPPAFPPRFDAPQHVQHGAQINITFGGLPGPHAVGQPAPATPPQREAQPFAAAPAAGPRHQAEPHAPLLTGPPVDRSQARNRHDQMLLFKQFALEATPGALVSADDMYARYAAWAGRRCMSPAVFHELFSEVAEVPFTQIGGQLYYADFAVRTSAVRAVS